MKTANRSIKNLCKVRWWLTFPLGGLAMCDLEREVVGNHRPVAAIEPVRGDAVFVSAAFLARHRWSAPDVCRRPAVGLLQGYCEPAGQTDLLLV